MVQTKLVSLDCLKQIQNSKLTKSYIEREKCIYEDQVHSVLRPSRLVTM